MACCANTTAVSLYSSSFLPIRICREDGKVFEHSTPATHVTTYSLETTPFFSLEKGVISRLVTIELTEAVVW